jgi:hypothetical protein
VAISLLGAALGLGSGVLGILTPTGQTDIEKVAVDRYHQHSDQSGVLPPGSSRTFPANAPGNRFALPLVSFAF